MGFQDGMPLEHPVHHNEQWVQPETVWKDVQSERSTIQIQETKQSTPQHNVPKRTRIHSAAMDIMYL